MTGQLSLKEETAVVPMRVGEVLFRAPHVPPGKVAGLSAPVGLLRSFRSHEGMDPFEDEGPVLLGPREGVAQLLLAGLGPGGPRGLDTGGTFLSMRVDQKPFDDIRVRRALNLAVNKQEIISSFYNGNAEMLAYPMHPDYIGYYEPLDKMPDSVKELFTFNPAKAKQLLKEAGYPNGFSFKVQVCSCSPDHMDLVPLIAAYLEQVGVKMEIQPMEYAAFLSAMTTKSHAAGYFMRNGHTNPTTSLRKSFVSKQTWNPSLYSDPAFDKKMMVDVYQEPDENRRKELVKEMTRDILDKAPYIWLPVAYGYSAWWPWVKNYGGELRAGAERPGPIHARMWIDHDLKKKLGY